MGACVSNKKGKTYNSNENVIVKSVVLDYRLKGPGKNTINFDKNKSINYLINSTIKNMNNNPYENESSSNYYLICPNCSNRSPHIEKFYYDNNAKDFIIKYSCICSTLYSPKEVPLSKILNNRKPLNLCNIHLNNKLTNYCKTCNKSICSKCKEESHHKHKIEKENIDRPISKEDAINLLNIIKEKEKQFNNEININEEQIEKGIEEKIEKLNEEKNNYRKQLKDYKENNQKTFCFLKNLYERYLNNFEDTNENNVDDNINNKNDIMLTNHIQNFAIKNNDISKFKTNVDEIINNSNNEKKELKLKNLGFQNDDLKISNNENTKEKGFKCIKELEGHKGKIVSLIELSSGKLLSGSYDFTLRIWDLNSEQEENVINVKSKVFCLLEFEKNKVLVGTSEYSILLLNIELQNEGFIHNFTGHELWVNSLVKCDEKYFASGANDATIKIWDFYNKKCIATLKGHNDCVLTLILLKNKNLCSGSADNTVRIWDWKEKICLTTLKGHEKWVKCVYELDNEIILSGSDDASIKVWQNYINIKTLKKHSHAVRTFCQINNNYFASGSFDCTIKIWEIKNWKCIQTLIGHNANIINIIKIEYNRDYYDTIASCSNDKTIRIWKGIL